METNTHNNTSPIKHDEDVKFERDKESTIIPLTESSDPVSPTAGETILPLKEETMGTSDFKPLTEEEKQPKLTEETGAGT